MFEQLKTLLVSNSEALALITKAENTFNSVKSELETKDSKLVDMKKSRDKFKGMVKTVQSEFKIDGDLTGDTLAEALATYKDGFNKNATERENELQNEIKALESSMKKNQAKFDSDLLSKEEEIFNERFETQVAQSMVGMDVINENAGKMVMGEIRNGASFDKETKTFVYKNADGTTKRNSDGTPQTISDRMKAVSTSDDFSFLFKANNANGSDTATGAGEGAGSFEEELMKSLANR